MNTLIIWLLVLVCLAPVVLVVMVISARKEWEEVRKMYEQEWETEAWRVKCIEEMGNYSMEEARKELEQWESQRQN